MTHPVWKTAGLLGPTRDDIEDAMETAAPVAAAGAIGSLGLGGLLKLQDLADRRTAHAQFGSLEELIRRIAAQPGVELPDKLRLLQTTPLSDQLGLGYASLPNLGAKMFGTEEALITPWTLRKPFSLNSDLGGLLTQITQGEMIDLAADAAAAADIADKPAGRVGAAIRKAKDAIRIGRNSRYLRDQATYSPSIVMHELGHISGSARGKIRALQGAGMIAGGVGTALGMGAATSENPYLSYGAPAIVAAGMAPTLIEEARASTGARKMMQRMVDEGIDPKNMGALRRALGPAYGTYLLGAAAPALIAGIIAKVMREKQERSTLGDVWAHGGQTAGDVAAYLKGLV